MLSIIDYSKIAKKLVYIIIVLLALNTYCYAEDVYSDFEKETGFVVEELDVSYDCADAEDVKIYFCDRNGIVIYVKSDINPRYVFMDYSGKVTEYENYDFPAPPYKVFNNGLADIELDNGKYGYIDQDYQWVIPPIYSISPELRLSEKPNGFLDKYTLAYIGDDQYLIDCDGRPCMSVDKMFESETTNFNPDNTILFSNGYAAYEKNGKVYYLDENLKSIEIDVGDTTNHEYGYFVFGGGTLIYSYGISQESEFYVGYRIFDHTGKVSYEYTLKVPKEDVHYITQFVRILPSGYVLFEEPDDFSYFESEAKHISVSVTGEVLGETREINNVCSYYFVNGIDDKVIRWPYIYDLSLNKISEIEWPTKTEYVFYSIQGEVFGDISTSKNDDSSVIIEKVRLIRGKDTQLNRSAQLVDPTKVPSFGFSAETNKISVYIDNEQINFVSEPIMENERILVPMRRIFEELDAIVTWDNDTNTATAVKDNTEIKISIDSDTMLKNGEAIKLDAPARLIDDAYTYVPLRAVSEAFGYKVIWSEELNRVDIITKI